MVYWLAKQQGLRNNDTRGYFDFTFSSDFILVDYWFHELTFYSLDSTI